MTERVARKRRENMADTKMRYENKLRRPGPTAVPPRPPRMATAILRFKRSDCFNMRSELLKKRDLNRCCRCFDSMIQRFFLIFKLLFSEESNIINKEGADRSADKVYRVDT